MIKSLKSVHKTNRGYTDFGIKIQYSEISDFFAN